MPRRSDRIILEHFCEISDAIRERIRATTSVNSNLPIWCTDIANPSLRLFTQDANPATAAARYEELEEEEEEGSELGNSLDTSRSFDSRVSQASALRLMTKKEQEDARSALTSARVSIAWEFCSGYSSVNMFGKWT